MNPTPPRAPTLGWRAALGACFFLSGATGLVYEVLWSRHLQLLFGSTTESVSVVLATFMTGLGLGAWALGARADRARSPLAIYAVLEIGVGLFALVTGPLLGAAASLYDRLAGDASSLSAGGTLLKIALSAAVLLPPAFLMGGTLPALVRGISRTTDEARRVIGLLYGLNTLGAVAGTVTTGFVLLERLGLTWTMRLTAAVNVALGAAVLALARRAAAEEPPAAEPAPAAPAGERGSFARIASTAAGRYALLGLFVSGATTMLYEVVFTRVLGLVFGVSTYAFTLVLAVFLAGLALGAGVQARLARVARSRIHEFAWAQTAVALLGALAAAAVPLASRQVMAIRQTAEPSFGATLALKAGIATALVLPLALAAGVAVPALLAALADDRRRLGSVVGDAYLVNTAGTMAGSLLAGFVLVPVLGTHGTLRAAGVVSALTGLLGLFVARERRALPVLGGVAAAAGLALALALPAWPAALFLVSDTGRYPAATTRADLERTTRAASHEVLFLKEGRTATVAVVRTAAARSLFVSGHPDASDALDMSTQVFLGVIPIAAHPAPKEALVIGFGSGVTAEAVARIDEVAHVDVLELEREVMDAAPYFHHVNRAVETSPKVRVIVDDARSFVRRARRPYDVIVSEPSNPWRAGVANVFTEDFFRAAARSLAPGGIFGQWVQLYTFDEELLALVLRTFTAVFPEAQVWWLDPGNVVLLGSARPIALDRARVERLLDGPFAAERVRWARVPSSPELFARCLLGTKGVRALAGRGPLHTDDRPLLEFRAPRRVYGGYGQMAERLLRAKRELGALSAPVSGEPPPPATLELGVAQMQRLAGDLPAALATLRAADPDGTDPAVLVRAAGVALEAGRVAAAQALMGEAAKRLEGAGAALRLEVAWTRARLAARTGRTDEALAAFAGTGEMDGAAGLEALDALIDAARGEEALSLAGRLLVNARLGTPLDADAVFHVHGSLRRLGSLGAAWASRAAAAVAASPAGEFSRCERAETLALLHGGASEWAPALAAAEEYEAHGGFEPSVMEVKAAALRALGRGREADAADALVAELRRPIRKG